MSGLLQSIDRVGVVFDDESLVADAGLLAAGTLVDRLGLEELVDRTVQLGGRVGGANAGRKILTVVASMLAGASHIDHVDRLRAGSTGRVLGFRVMAPSTVGTFLRSFTWGHVRQLEKVLTLALRRAWRAGGRSPQDGCDHRFGLDDLWSVGQSQGRRLVWVYEGVGLSPSVGHPGGHRRSGRRPPAGRGITARCSPFRPRNHTPRPAGRSRRSDERAGRLWVLVLRHGRSLGPTGAGLVGHRPPERQGQSHDHRDRRRSLDGYRLPRRRESTSRRNRTGDDQLQEAVAAAQGTARGAPHPPHGTHRQNSGTTGGTTRSSPTSTRPQPTPTDTTPEKTTPTPEKTTPTPTPTPTPTLPVGWSRWTGTTAATPCANSPYATSKAQAV